MIVDCLLSGLASMDLATQTHELLMDAMARNVVEMATEMIILEHVGSTMAY